MKKIDIHNHILWGIDDGARTKEQSLEMLKIAADHGIAQIIATPHYHYRRGKADPQTILKKVEELRAAAGEAQIPVQLHAGNELYYTHDLLEELKSGCCLTLAGTDYVLLEFSLDSDQKRIQNAVYQFLSAGYNPIIAHVERYEVFHHSREALREISEMGAYFQVNAGSLFGGFHWKRKHFVRSILNEGMVQFLATDAHDPQKRPPQFGKSDDWFVKKWGDAKSRKVLYENAQRMLNNQII